VSINPGGHEGIEILQGIAAEALDSEDFRRELMTDPKAVLRNRNLDVDDDVDIEVVQNSPERVYFVLPSSREDVDFNPNQRAAHRLLNWWPV
jgi:hypothetical protein